MTSESRPEKSRPSDRLIGEVLANRYQIEKLLGEGAMGAVYRARHVKVGRAFAVKVLHPSLLEDRKVAQRFEREAELAGRLRHPNVIGVVDVGEIDGMSYMVMDFAEGSDLAALLGEAPMPAPRVISLTRQMLEGLYHAHEAGLIHRDFKPENVIVERDDHDMEVPRIVDFGIAILREGGDSPGGAGRLTTNGLVLGTPHYMAPEQAVADPIDHRIDLFALGIVVYELLCGKLPFDGTGAEVARANLLLDPPAIAKRVPYLEVDPLLEAFARRLMAKKREHRPATAKVARELLDLIERDPDAAAKALGITLPASARLPQVTQPSPPQHPGTTAAVEAPAVVTPVATPELPRAERYLPTAPADPLAWRAKRRKWIQLVALGAIGLALAIVFGVLRSDKPAPRVPLALGGVADAGAPVADAEVVLAIDAAEEPPPIVVDAAPVTPVRDAAVVPPVINKLDKPGKHPGKPVSAPPGPKPGSNTPVVTEPVPPPNTGANSNTVIAEFTAIGAEIKRLRLKLGDAAVADVDKLYRRIHPQEAIATQATRDRTMLLLAELRRQLRKLPGT